jgi:chaperonin GroEL
LKQSTSADEQAAYRILIRAFEEPLRTLAANAGYEPANVMADLRSAGPCHGFDVTTGQVVDVIEAGILDAASVVASAARRAISSAALALSTDVLVHHKSPEQALNP